MNKKLTDKEIKTVLNILENTYPEAKSELNFSNPFEMLISTILSAQCTDKQVNKVTEKLFQEYKCPKDFLSLSEEELGEKIKSCGFYKNKSKNILGTCKMLEEQYNEKVPDDRDELMKLPGVGRKTANVVISNAYKKDAIAVDTHVFRVSNRIGLADSNDVYETEMQLMNNIDKKMWSKAHHLLIFHGRRICKSRKPSCEICPINEYCLYYKDNIRE